MMGDDGDLVPVRDNAYMTNNKQGGPKLEDYKDAAQQRAAQQRRMVAKWTREDLEDKYLRMYEENLILKRHARKQEDKIKRMATKLLRLVSDKKKAADSQTGTTGKKIRDIETEEMLEELHSKIREYERQNHQLKEKLMVAKQQISTQGSRKNAYPSVQARINTGIPRTPADPRLTKSMRVTGPAPPVKASPQGLPRYGHSLLEDARAENKQLEDVIHKQNEQIYIFEQDIEILKEQAKVREAEYEEDLLKIKQQMTLGQRATIQENIDVIRLQREVKEKATKLIQLQAQYTGLDEKLRGMHGTHDQVLNELERVKQQLMEEQNRRLAVESELRMGTSSQRTLVEYQERLRDMERECEILKEANEKLVTSAFDLEREREWRQRENALKVQVAQLEATLKADVGEKGSILDRLSEERDNHEKLEEEHRELRINYFQIKQEYDDLKDKMKFFSKESAVDFQEIEEALMIVKQRKERENQELDFLQKVDDEMYQDKSKMFRELQSEHADTINELEKTRNMLILQHKINKDYQMEVDLVTKKMEENKKEFDTRQQELAQLLDIRACRIRKLETQMRDVAYGTKQYRVRSEQPQDEDGSDLDELEETISLERGQNLFEIHIKRAVLSQEALRIMGDEEPSMFATWEFYEFEIQSTPVMRSAKPEFVFTSQYVVKVDDFFLHYLQKDSCTLELHQSFGTDYRTMAACQLSMREILDKSQGRLHGTAMLTGTTGEGEGISFGTVEYWVRLKVPMEQALRLYKERSKALGYIESNIRTAEQALEAMDETAAKRPADNLNQLHINVLRCTKLKGRREDTVGVQPSPYCVYKFFDFPDHDTTIVESSNNPEYNDHKSFPVPMTADLDKYLKAKPLLVYVFDDTDPEETVYLGVAEIPLIPLAHDKPVHGMFELFNKERKQTGTVEISLKWQFSYLPPKGATRTLAQVHAMPDEQKEDVHLLPGEEEALEAATVATTASPAPKPPRERRGGPIAASTPIVGRRRIVQVEQPTQDAGREERMEAEQEMNDSDVYEESPVPGESELVTSGSEASTTRGLPPRERRSPPDVHQAAIEAQARRAVAEAMFDKDEEEEEEEEIVEEEEEKTPEQLIAEELGGQLSQTGEMADTMFEDPKNSDEVDDSDIDEESIPDDENGQGSDRSSYAGTESDIVMASPNSRPQSSLANMNPADVVVVAISELSVDEDSPMNDWDHVKKLYVEYTFLGVPRDETETPYSLPRPTADKPISFNFTKVFHVDFERNYERRQYLASMLLPEDPDNGRIRFTVVAEPEDPDEDCEDVGAAYVDLHKILNTQTDLEDHDVPIMDVKSESEHLGNLRLTVKCLRALQAVRLEMRQPGDSIEG